LADDLGADPAWFPAITTKQASAHFEKNKADLAIILVKAGQTPGAADLVYDIVRPGGAVITLQNGAGYQDHLLSLHHRFHLMRGITFSGASVVSPGVLQLNGKGQSVIAPFNPESYESDYVGVDSPHNDLDVCQAIADLFNRLGMETVAFPDNNTAFERILWEKLAVNSVINPLTALFNVRNGELLEHIVARELIPLLINEIYNVLHVGHNISITSEAIEQRVMNTLKLTERNVSSMLADVRRQVPTEIEFMNGQIVRLGIQSKIPTPVNIGIVDMMREIEESYATPRPSYLNLAAIDPKSRDVLGKARQEAQRSARTFGIRRFSTSTPRGIHVADDVESFRKFRSSLSSTETLGFVPTMGALHIGHISLAQEAKRQCNKVAVSIFVNPTQFAAHEDLGAYPRTLQQDLQLLEANGVDVVFAPRDSSVMYPPGFSMSVHVPDATSKKEGSIRPHHFNGVATVCLKLFNIVQPTAVFFGQKDAQQCATIKSLVKDFNVPTKVVICPTLRDQNGLALSSRNAYLSVEEKKASRVLYWTLCELQKQCLVGDVSAGTLRAEGMKMLASEPLSSPQYVGVADLDTMVELEGPISHEQLQRGVCISVASKVGKVRLIDNFAIIGNRDGQLSR
jgi:pantoate--beta-alanine ligase